MVSAETKSIIERAKEIYANRLQVELESKHMVLTVPSDLIRKLDDPDALMKRWDEIMAVFGSLTDGF